jgi:hypothetical protein
MKIPFKFGMPDSLREAALLRTPFIRPLLRALLLFAS